MFEFADGHVNDDIRQEYQLLLPFPRKIFTREQQASSTLSALGLVPNASLNVFVPQPPQESAVEQARIETEEEMESTDTENEQPEEEQQPDRHTPANRQEVSAAVLARLERLERQRQESLTKNKKECKRLRDICFDIVSKLFLDSQLCKYVSDLRFVSSSICEALFDRMVKQKKLDRIVVKRFAKRYITSNGTNEFFSNLVSVNMDYYDLASDIILESLALWHKKTLERISLRGCSVITDKGLNTLKGTKLNKMKSFFTVDRHTVSELFGFTWLSNYRFCSKCHCK